MNIYWCVTDWALLLCQHRKKKLLTWGVELWHHTNTACSCVLNDEADIVLRVGCMRRRKGSLYEKEAKLFKLRGISWIFEP